MSAEPFRVVSSGYGSRYGVFSQYAPEPAPYGRSRSCSHVAPDSCRSCDGTDLWAQARIPEAIPPCLMPNYAEEKAS